MSAYEWLGLTPIALGLIAIAAGLIFPLGRKSCDHEYGRVGYGGAGWSLYVCQTCGEKEIDA